MKKILLCLGVFAGSGLVTTEVKPFIPNVFQVAANSAQAVAQQCLYILNMFGEKGIAIVRTILSQVPEFAAEVIEILRKAGHKI